MLHAIVLVWLGSFVLVLLLAVFYILDMRRQFASSSLTNINRNLSKMDLFWSPLQSTFRPLGESSPLADQKNLVQSTQLMALVFSFLSLLGLLLMILMVLSTRFFARSRLEMAVFKSPLATDPELTHQQVLEIVENFKAQRM
jgi:uncharacterized protein involved in exopolysaccharide biosynthesis